MGEMRLLGRLVASAAVMVLATALGSSVATAGLPPEDCEPLITKIQDFGAGAGALRNTSTDGEQTAGSAKSKSITVVVQLVCRATESRQVTVDLSGTNLIGGSAPIVTEASKSLFLEGGGTGRFKFSVSYDKTNCAGGAGPVPKDQGGVKRVNDPAFQWIVAATNSDVGGTDPGPNADTIDDETAALLCKPSRTTAP